MKLKHWYSRFYLLNNMKAVQLPAYNNNLIRALLGMKVEEIEKPVPKEGEVLIKVEASPCNPSDIAFLRGGYNIQKTLPAIPGFEGVGVIEAVGVGIEESLIGNRVSCFVQEDHVGMWSEYVTAKITDCIALKDEMPLDQAACFAVNPFTAFGLYEMSQVEECDCIIQNAAAGQVGRFIRALAKKDGVKVINIVRKEEHVEQLKTEGEAYVFNSESENFEDCIRKFADLLKPTMAFDAVGGDQSGLLLNVMPEDSELVLYGGLSGADFNKLDVMGIIFNRKIVSGFNLMDWMQDLEDDEFEEVSEYLQDLFIDGTLRTEISSQFPIDEVVKGIRTYIANMSGGKILLTP